MNHDEASDIIILGAGLSGLQCAYTLVNSHGVDRDRIVILDAQDYIGGRIKQDENFVPGCKIDLGAEFIHGGNTKLNEFARVEDEPLEDLFCWAHGDGGIIIIDINRISIFNVYPPQLIRAFGLCSKWCIRIVLLQQIRKAFAL